MLLYCVLSPGPRGVHSWRDSVSDEDSGVGADLQSMSWEFRDSSHGMTYQRGSTMVTMGPARDCANGDTSVYLGSGPSRLEVNPYFLPASY
jgi:hypothetical protein